MSNNKSNQETISFTERERERERDYRSIMWYLRASVLETYPTWIWLLI